MEFRRLKLARWTGNLNFQVGSISHFIFHPIFEVLHRPRSTPLHASPRRQHPRNHCYSTSQGLSQRHSLLPEKVRPGPPPRTPRNCSLIATTAQPLSPSPTPTQSPCLGSAAPYPHKSTWASALNIVGINGLFYPIQLGAAGTPGKVWIIREQG